MKKLLVLMLVFGMASLASAVYVLELDGLDEATLTGDGNYSAYFITAYGGTTSMQVLFNGDGTTVVDYTTTQAYRDAAASYLAIDESELTAVWLLTILDSSEPYDPTNDVIVARFTSTNMPVTVTMHDSGDISNITSVTLTPEPMTMMLLGLGGLFLRRRKAA